MADIFHEGFVPAQGAFLALLITTAVLTPLAIHFLWTRRDTYHVKARPIRSIVGTVALHGLISLEICARHVFLAQIPCWSQYLQFCLVLMLQNCYMSRIWFLWNAFKSTLERSRSKRYGSSPELSTSLTSTSTPYLDTRHRTSDAYMFKAFTTICIIQLAIFFSSFVVSPEVLTSPSSPQRLECNVKGVSFYVAYIMYSFGVGAFLYVAYQFRVVSDAFGMKNELKYIGIATIGYTVAFIVCFLVGESAWFWSGFSDALVHVIYITILGFYPIYLSLVYERKIKNRKEMIKAFPSLTTALADTELRLAFEEHLEREFAIENLRFLDKVDRFRSYFKSRSDAENERSAKRIIASFLLDGAPSQVNIDDQTKQGVFSAILNYEELDLSKMSSDGAKLHLSATTEAFFDACRHEVFVLIETDSYMRFRVDKMNVDAPKEDIDQPDIPLGRTEEGRMIRPGSVSTAPSSPRSPMLRPVRAFAQSHSAEGVIPLEVAGKGDLASYGDTSCNEADNQSVKEARDQHDTDAPDHDIVVLTEGAVPSQGEELAKASDV